MNGINSFCGAALSVVASFALVFGLLNDSRGFEGGGLGASTVAEDYCYYYGTTTYGAD